MAGSSLNEALKRCGQCANDAYTFEVGDPPIVLGAIAQHERALIRSRMAAGRAALGAYVFLPKHRRGNPGGYTPYFQQNADGTYSLL